jgi:uncharacterized protein YgiB involved in biofilm formation
MRSRKSSLRVSVVLAGATALAACDVSPRYSNRDMYASAEECQKDWGRPQACEQGYRSGSGGARVWYGPSYDSSSSAARSPRAIGAASVSRGGFGSLSSFHGVGS